MNKKLLGILGEYLAIFFLKIKFYKIIAHNYQSKYGEIDIIAKKRNIIVFLEVKVRTNLDKFDQPVHYSQIARIKRSAEIYLVKNKLYNKCLNIRFDLIIIRNLLKLEHYTNVW